MNKYCIHVIIEKLKTISRGTAESYLASYVLQSDNYDIMAFDSYSDARNFLKDDIYEHVEGWEVKGYEIREFIPFGGT